MSIFCVRIYDNFIVWSKFVGKCLKMSVKNDTIRQKRHFSSWRRMNHKKYENFIEYIIDVRVIVRVI